MLPENDQPSYATSGDEELFVLVKLYYQDLFRYAIRFTADIELTKDLVSQFFVHAWEKREQVLRAENKKAYLVVSFKRFLINYFQRSSPFRNIADFPDDLIEHSYEDYIIQFQQDEAMKHALHSSLHSLPPGQKELLMCRFYDNMSYEEIAAKNSLSVRTVYNKIHLALKKMRTSKLLDQLRKR